MPIEDIRIGTYFYMSLRAFGASNYAEFNGIIDRYTQDYYLKAKIENYVVKKDNKINNRRVMISAFG